MHERKIRGKEGNKTTTTKGKGDGEEQEDGGRSILRRDETTTKDAIVGMGRRGGCSRYLCARYRHINLSNEKV